MGTEIVINIVSTLIEKVGESKIIINNDIPKSEFKDYIKKIFRTFLIV